MLKPIQPLRFVLSLIILQFISSCANIVAPTGGPKDEDPPVVIRSNPPNFTTAYAGQDVRIFFDEFVTLKDLNKNFLVSPPLKEEPEVKIRGRSIIMSLKDTLMENTTYVFFFGESIVDITEGNPIPNFQFVASTGDFVDSLSVLGKVNNAFTLEPEAGVFVMLYENVYDSVPMQQRPVYVSKTNKEGEFQITNMRDGEYLMFALRDMNFNYLYDTPDEKIAFLDTLIKPAYLEKPQALEEEISEEEDTEENENLIPDDIEKDELDTENILSPDTGNNSDTIPDSLAHTGRRPSATVYELFMFQEKDTFQRILSASLAERGKVNLIFRIPADSIVLKDYRNPIDYNWYIPEYSKQRDTLTLWLPDIQRDSLFLEVSDKGNLIDSIRVSLVMRAVRGSRATTDTIKPKLEIKPSNLRSGVMSYYQLLELQSPSPIKTIDAEQIFLFKNDSIPLNAELRFKDDIGRKLELVSDVKPDSSYTLMIPPGAIMDIFGLLNDTIQVRFRADNSEKYGSVHVNIELPRNDEQYILQLLDQGMNLIDEKIISENRIYRFDHLAAGNYKLRLIWDQNRNGIWDTGNYLQCIQPEIVHIYPEQIQARLNWEVEVIWGLFKEQIPNTE